MRAPSDSGSRATHLRAHAQESTRGPHDSGEEAGPVRGEVKSVAGSIYCLISGRGSSRARVAPVAGSVVGRGAGMALWPPRARGRSSRGGDEERGAHPAAAHPQVPPAPLRPSPRAVRCRGRQRPPPPTPGGAWAGGAAHSLLERGLGSQLPLHIWLLGEVERAAGRGTGRLARCRAQSESS